MISEFFHKKPFRRSLVISVFIIYMASCIHPNQILFSSKYYQLGLGIPVHSIMMYMTKLYSVRSICMLLGSLFEYFFHRITGIKRIHVAMFMCGMLYTTRMVIWIYLLIYEEPAVIFYYMSIFEAFVCGMFQICFQIVFAHFMSILMVSKDFCYILVSIIQMIINFFFSGDPLMVILIQHFFSFFLCFVGFVLWYLFICKCRELPFVIDDSFIQQLKNLLEYFVVDIIGISKRNNLIVDRNGLLAMINDKKNLLDYLLSEMKKLLEDDEERFDYAKTLIKAMKNEYNHLESILKYENSITPESKISEEVVETIKWCQEVINSKIAALKNLIEEVYMERRKLDDSFDIEKNLEESQMKYEESFWLHFKNVISPLFMIIFAAFFRQLYPIVYPEGLLERRKANYALLLIPFGFIIGSLWTWYFEKHIRELKERYNCYLRGWLSLIPMWFGFIISIVGVHTDWWYLRNRIKSGIRVSVFGMCVMAAYSIMRSTSCVHIANYITEDTKNKESSSRVLSLQNILLLSFNYLFFKMALSYGQGKIRLGYIPPNFEVNEDISNEHTVSFWIKYVFTRTILEIVRDLSVRIRIYT